MTFREATGADTPAIRFLLESANLPTESLGMGITAFFLAEEEGKLVGMAGFEYYNQDALLRSVAVPVTLRSQGIGSRMVTFMLEQAKQRRVRRIILLTETARDFFAAKGFDEIERSRLNNPALAASSEFAHACPTSAVCMVYEVQAGPGGAEQNPGTDETRGRS